jgi:hypothetical protein
MLTSRDIGVGWTEVQMLESPATLEELVVEEEPHATFHDAGVQSIAVDFANGTCTMECDLAVGDPEDADKDVRERRRLGRLVFKGLLLWVFEPPVEVPRKPGGALWLTSDGPLGEASAPSARSLALSAPIDAVRWYFYFSNLNVFAYIAAAGVVFEWQRRA